MESLSKYFSNQTKLRSYLIELESKQTNKQPLVNSIKISEDCVKPRETICNVVYLKKIYIILIIYRLKSQKNSSKNVSTKYLLSSKEVGLFFPRQKVSLFAK